MHSPVQGVCSPQLAADPGNLSQPVPLNGALMLEAGVHAFHPAALHFHCRTSCSLRLLAGVHKRQISGTSRSRSRYPASRRFRSPLGLHMHRDNYLVGNGRSAGGPNQLLRPNSTIAATSEKASGGTTSPPFSSLDWILDATPLRLALDAATAAAFGSSALKLAPFACRNPPGPQPLSPTPDTPMALCTPLGALSRSPPSLLTG